MRVAVLGSHGFVGSAVTECLQQQGHTVTRVRAPRLREADLASCMEYPTAHPEEVFRLANQFRACDAVVNAAGNPDASSQDLADLLGANAAIPGLVASASQEAHIARVVHVSTAAVQGRRPTLDESPEVSPFSPYSWSKAIGERAFHRWSPHEGVIYRPGSVHAHDRRVTRGLTRIARSPLSSVAGPGDAPTPQAHIRNVASAVAFLSTTDLQPPPIVIHPWEGFTTKSLLETLGGRRPKQINSHLANGLVWIGRRAGRLSGRLEANVRRVEMCWFGQPQAPSWLSTSGWTPPYSLVAWESLNDTAAGDVRGQLDSTSPHPIPTAIDVERSRSSPPH